MKNAFLPPLPEWPANYRLLVAVFTLTVALAYLLGTLFIGQNTHFTPSGVVTHFKGNMESGAEEVGEIKFEKPLRDMLLTTHNHLFGLSVVFSLLGFLFLHAGKQAPWKTTLALELLFSLWTTFGGMWLVRFVHWAFVYLVLFSSLVMSTSFFFMAATVFYASVKPFFSPEKNRLRDNGQ